MLQTHWTSALFLMALMANRTLAAPNEQPVQFNRDIRPILADRCFQCHGPDALQRQAGLRLDDRQSATGKLESGTVAIVPGDVAASALIQRIRATADDERMPPPDSGKTLSAVDMEKLATWITQGAKYEQHWAFLPLQEPTPPAVQNEQWVRGAIDRFVLAGLEQAGLSPAPEASRETLIRRVALDLTGLPPTLAEIDAFLADESPQAYERMVDQYFRSPAYGEHLARGWLDLARYADSNGYQYDTEREQWVWRDWVIDAFNRNVPFDQFTIEQLAGDLLPNATPQQRLATGFNRNHGVTIEGGVIDEEYRTEYVMDRLVTTATAWLGLTIGCARCHDHKFDPISQREFYQLFAFFNQVAERGLNGFDPTESIPSPFAAQQQAAIRAELERLREELAQPDEELAAQAEQWAAQIAATPSSSWTVLEPREMKSSGGSQLTRLPDNSVLVGEANPDQDIYELSTDTTAVGMTAVRLEALTHESLPGGGPGRHSNSNFVLSEFELIAVAQAEPNQTRPIKFVRAFADYSQTNYDIANAIDGSVAGNNGWAVDGPTRKEPATAVFVAESPFGFVGGTKLQFRLRHEAGFTTHGIGRPRLSVTTAPPADVTLQGLPATIVAIANKSAVDRTPEERQELLTYYGQRHSSRLRHIGSRITDLERQLAAPYPATMIMRDRSDPRPTFILHRGQYNEPTESVSPGVPAVFPPLPSGAEPNRLALARWLVDPVNPLTARVAVNRFWQRLFGVGIVKTSNDFGTQGALPSHPQLLDWLAIEFVRSGWDMRHVQRLIVTSATYRQSSQVPSESYLRDPENRLLARGPRLRLEAEEIRDSALAVSGLLVRQVGGRSVYPYQPAGLWTELNNRPGYSKEYPQGHGDELYRRSVYTFWKRTVPLPMLKLFDAPDREVCLVQRSRTNTPLQSLVLLNGPQFVEAARHLGRRMATASRSAVEDRMIVGFRLVTGRLPTDAELAVLAEHYSAEHLRFARDPAATDLLLAVGESPRDRSLDPVDHAAWTSVARLLLNLDEFITKE